MDTQEPGASALTGKTALVTGGARRIGAAIVRSLHQRGANIALHYHRSHDQARHLAATLAAQRAGSVELIQADLLDETAPERMVRQAWQRWRRLDVLINNASAFYPTPIGQIDTASWNELLGSNLKAPLFLCQAAADALRATQGCIINLADIHAQRPTAAHAVYCAAKAGLVALTRSLARELAPAVRVNAIAPGAILPPPGQAAIAPSVIAQIPLQRPGNVCELADAVIFLVQSGSYITGQVLAVDGGRSL